MYRESHMFCTILFFTHVQNLAKPCVVFQSNQLPLYSTVVSSYLQSLLLARAVGFVSVQKELNGPIWFLEGHANCVASHKGINA